MISDKIRADFHLLDVGFLASRTVSIVLYSDLELSVHCYCVNSISKRECRIESTEHNMSDERQPCRSCAGILSDFSLFDALISEEGVNFSQTAQEFYTAVDNGCLICSEIHVMACRYAEMSESATAATAAFRYRPQSVSDVRRDLTINIQFDTIRLDSYDFISCGMALCSSEYRWISTLGLDVEAQESKYILVPAPSVGLRRSSRLSNPLQKAIQQ